VEGEFDPPEVAPDPSPALEAVGEAGTRTLRDGETDEVWRCQATEALKATEHLKVFKNPGQYWREFNNGNFGRVRFVGLFIRALAMEIWKRLGFLPVLPMHGPGPEAPDYEPLDLQPGELVQVRSAEEIRATLDDKGFNRALSFDREMLRYCGKTLRVKARVDRIVDESSGRMLRINKDCIILEGSVCSGECSTGRWFCGREIYAYWREAWLRRVEEPASQNGTPLPMRVERVG
jgi:hypothetical protein